MAQTASLEDQLPLLFDLQAIDEEVRDLTGKRRAQVRRVRAREAERNEEQARLNARRQEYTDVQLQHRKKNTELLAGQGKLAGFQEKQSTARDAHEYVAFGKQIETSTRVESELEDATIELLLAVDEAKEALDAESARFEEVEKTFQDERKRRARAVKKLDAELAERGAAREQSAARIDPVLLRDYEHWRERSDQTMVAKVVTIKTAERAGKNAPVTITYSCGGCHMTIPTQLMLEARAYTKRYSCPACHRVLYVPPEEPEDADEAAGDE